MKTCVGRLVVSALGVLTIGVLADGAQITNQLDFKMSQPFTVANTTLPAGKDIGGHFGLEAARYAALHFTSDAVMGIEMEGPFTGQHRIFLHFAGEIVATAMLRHATGSNRDHKVNRLISLAHIGYRHATTCVHCVVAYHLWGCFGK